MTKKYVLFKDNGTPVRARVNLSFKEYKPVEIQLKQSPRSSPDKYKKYVMIEGDRILGTWPTKPMEKPPTGGLLPRPTRSMIPYR